MWRVSNGCKIWIWNDRWVLNPSTFKIISPPILLDSEATVSFLVDVQSKWWNISLLNSLFTEDEVQKIKEIPLSCTNQEDTFIWRGTKNGIFPIKSAYHMQKELSNRMMATSSTPMGSCAFWRSLWALPVPNMEKKFLRRLAKIFYQLGIIYTKGELLWILFARFVVWRLRRGSIFCGNVHGPWAMQNFKNVPFRGMILYSCWSISLTGVTRRN